MVKRYAPLNAHLSQALTMLQDKSTVDILGSQSGRHRHQKGKNTFFMRHRNPSNIKTGLDDCTVSSKAVGGYPHLCGSPLLLWHTSSGHRFNIVESGLSAHQEQSWQRVGGTEALESLSDRGKPAVGRDSRWVHYHIILRERTIHGCSGKSTVPTLDHNDCNKNHRSFQKDPRD
jgi:hypothetical protein